MVTKRKAIPKKMRFEVFKRDSFKCQYCGKSAPEVILHADHINPVYEGGRNTLTNLITSCEACNLGKGKRKLSDNTAVEKQKAQLDELNERRIQLEMMMKWREGLNEIEDTKLKYVREKWESHAKPFTITENGVKNLKSIVGKFPLEVVLDSIEASCGQYLRTDNKGKVTIESVQKSFDYIGKICANKKREQERPYLRDLYYVRGILKNRFSQIDMWEALDLLEDAYNNGISLGRLKEVVRSVRYWGEFKDEIRYLIRG